MNRAKLFLTLPVVILVLAAIGVRAQRRTTPRPQSPRPTPTATASPKPTTPAAQPSPTQPGEIAPVTLAVVNDITITASDIQDQLNATILNDPDLYLRAFYQDREKAIKEARQRAVEARIGSLLIATQAKKQGITAEELLDREINSKIVPPSDAEIRAAYNANRDQIGGADLESVRGNSFLPGLPRLAFSRTCNAVTTRESRPAPGVALDGTQPID